MSSLLKRLPLYSFVRPWKKGISRTPELERHVEICVREHESKYSISDALHS